MKKRIEARSSLTPFRTVDSFLLIVERPVISFCPFKYYLTNIADSGATKDLGTYPDHS